MKEFILQYKNLKVYDLLHAVDRFKERFPQYSLGTFKKLLKRGIKKIDELYHLTPNEYILIYTNRNLKIPFEISDIGKVFTVLKIDEHPIDLKDAIKVIVEAIVRYNLKKEEIVNLLKRLNTDPPESIVMELASKYKMTIVDSMDDSGFHFLIEEGKPYKTWIEVYVDEGENYGKI